MQRPMEDLGQLLYNISNPKPGRRGHPRMNRAVDLRLKRPELTLLEALSAAGFVFSSPTQPSGEQGGHGDDEIFDADGVALSKRKNQLSKRLWQAKQRLQCTNEMIKEEQVARVEPLGRHMPSSIKTNRREPPNQFNQRITKTVHQDDFNLKFDSDVGKINVNCEPEKVLSSSLTSHCNSQRHVSTKGNALQETKFPFERMLREDKGKKPNLKRGLKRSLEDDDNESFIAMIDSVFDDETTSLVKKEASGNLCRETKIQKRHQDFGSRSTNTKGCQDNGINMQKALSFYQSELGAIVEESMIEAGFTPEETKQKSLQYIKFVEHAAKNTFQKIEEMRNLTNSRTFQEIQRQGKGLGEDLIKREQTFIR